MSVLLTLKISTIRVENDRKKCTKYNSFEIDQFDLIANFMLKKQHVWQQRKKCIYYDFTAILNNKSCGITCGSTKILNNYFTRTHFELDRSNFSFVFFTYYYPLINIVLLGNLRSRVSNVYYYALHVRTYWLVTVAGFEHIKLYVFHDI